MLHKLYDQTTFSDKAAGTYGDCFAACCKTLLQNPLEGFPHPINHENGEWNPAFFDALEKAEFDVTYNKNRPNKDFSFLPQFVMACGPTVRTETTGATHAVVWDTWNRKMVHDPHPSRAGILEIDCWYWFN